MPKKCVLCIPFVDSIGKKNPLDAIQILKDMPAFDWAVFIAQMQARKYEVKTQTDKEGKIKGLSFKKGNLIQLAHKRIGTNICCYSSANSKDTEFIIICKVFLFMYRKDNKN